MAATDTRRCIYCLEEKPVSAFNREHVVQDSFCDFENPFVITCVCTVCNTHFANGIDLKLARDTVEGIERVKEGLVHPSKFKSLGKRSTTHAVFGEKSKMQGALAHHVPDPSGVGLALTPSPQVGFAASPDGPFEWFYLWKLPTRDALRDSRGGKKGDLLSIRIWGVDLEEARRVLVEKGFAAVETAETQTEPPPSGREWAETVEIIDEPKFRVVTKIAFNYLAHRAGPQIALMPQFNEARRFVRDAVRPPERIVTDVRVNPWSVRGKGTGKVVRGHYVCIGTYGQDVIAQVSLLSRLRYTIVLARGGFLVPIDITGGHFFNLDSRRIEPMPVLPFNG